MGEYPRDGATGAATVMLIDSLNTSLEGQARVHKEMARYFSSFKPSGPVAIFTLGTQLRCVRGFTTDATVLEKALSDKDRGVRLERSPLLSSTLDEMAAERAVAEMGAANGIQDDQKRTIAFQLDKRLALTFEAFNKLADLLRVVPGRKNVVWFSGSFPTLLLPDVDEGKASQSERDYREQVRDVDAALVGAQVAIYPIEAEGLANASLYNVDTQFATVHSAKELQDQANSHALQESIARNANHATMDQIADETGGIASYNTNGYREALDRVSRHGNSYYTLYYTPTNTKLDGAFRAIRLRIGKDKSQLMYRRGYYAVSRPKGLEPAADSSDDPTMPYMSLDVPAYAAIPVTVRARVLEDAASQGPASLHDSAFPGRLGLDIVVAVGRLGLREDAKGRHEGVIDIGSTVYDSRGKPVNTAKQRLSVDFDDVQYDGAKQNGIQAYLELDAPVKAGSLRVVVYDPGSALAGSLDIDLEEITKGNACVPSR